MAKYVHDTLKGAKQDAALTGRNRIYVVRKGADSRFVVAPSPDRAIGLAGSEFGLTAELAEPRIMTAAERQEVAEIEAFARLDPAARKRILEALGR